MKIMSSALSEYKIIVKSRIFYTFLFLTAVFIFMEGFYLYNTLLPETVNEQIEWYSQSLFSLSESVAMDREMIIDLLRPIHPFTSFLNPIYVFDILAIVIFVIVSSILMGVEFKNKTIKVKKSNFSTLHIFLSKILAVEYAYISYIIFAMTVNAVTSLVFWGRIKNEYGFFLDKFNLNFEFSLHKSFRDIGIFFILSSIAIIFYSTLSMCITYLSSLSSFGMSVCVLPIFRFESEISKAIVLPMDIYIYVLNKNLTRQEQGFNGIAEGNSLSMTSIQMIMVCIVIFTLEAILLFGVASKKKRV